MLISPVGEDVGTVEGDKHSDNNLHFSQDHFPLFKLFKDRHFSSDQLSISFTPWKLLHSSIHASLFPALLK